MSHFIFILVLYKYSINLKIIKYENKNIYLKFLNETLNYPWNRNTFLKFIICLMKLFNIKRRKYNFFCLGSLFGYIIELR